MLLLRRDFSDTVGHVPHKDKPTPGQKLSLSVTANTAKNLKSFQNFYSAKHSSRFQYDFAGAECKAGLSPQNRFDKKSDLMGLKDTRGRLFRVLPEDRKNFYQQSPLECIASVASVASSERRREIVGTVDHLLYTQRNQLLCFLGIHAFYRFNTCKSPKKTKSPQRNRHSNDIRWLYWTPCDF